MRRQKVNNRKVTIMKHWIFNRELGYPQCPICMRWIHVFSGDAVMNYCPNCGEHLNGEEFKKHTLHGEVTQQKRDDVAID